MMHELGGDRVPSPRGGTIDIHDLLAASSLLTERVFALHALTESKGRRRRSHAPPALLQGTHHHDDPRAPSRAPSSCRSRF
jgi:hypothetical protein